MLDAPAVIVIEDDVDARRIYSDYLRSKGWTVFTAADGRSGLDKTIELTPGSGIAPSPTLISRPSAATFARSPGPKTGMPR